MITVNFAAEKNILDRTFQSFQQLRSSLRSIAYAPIYRIRSNQDEFGRVISRKLFAISKDGREHYLGNVVMQGDRQC